MPVRDKTELKFMIALTMVPAIGPVTARKLIRNLGSARAVFDQNRYVLEKIPGMGPQKSGSIELHGLLERAEKEVGYLERHHIVPRYYKDKDFPPRLNQCPDAPILLYTQGEQGLHCKKSLSVVGTRRATSYGKDMCREIIKGLTYLVDDLVIVSGLAFGIDVIAHRAALDYGLPTVAVLGHGLSTIYPWAHRDVAKRICEQGSLVTDFPSGMKPERNNFLRRNRIIAGLSNATLVVESPKKGGALITAHMAVSYDRDVLAIPGRVLDDRSRGCNNLIKNSVAALVESPEDLMSHLNWEISSRPMKPEIVQGFHPDPDERKILKMICKVPGIDPGMISSHTGIPIQRVLSCLIDMEMKEWVSPKPGNQYHVRISLG
jgi:DNA processing protein